jgi:hypothetical protein
MAFQLTLIKTIKASITRNQATVRKIKVQNKLLLTSKLNLCLLISRQYTRKLISEKFMMHIFFLDEVDTYELLPIKELANKFLQNITREKFSENTHKRLHSDKHA